MWPGCAQNSGISAVFALAPPTLETSRNVSQQQSPLPKHLWVCDRQCGHQLLMKKALRETQTLRARCSKAEPKIFAPPQTPFPGAQDGQNLISWRWPLPVFLLDIQPGEFPPEILNSAGNFLLVTWCKFLNVAARCDFLFSSWKYTNMPWTSLGGNYRAPRPVAGFTGGITELPRPVAGFTGGNYRAPRPVAGFTGGITELPDP